MKCQKCGAEIDKNDSFCKCCGDKINNEFHNNERTDLEKKKDKEANGLIIFIFWAAVLIVIICAVNYGSKQSSNNEVYNTTQKTAHDVTYKISGSAEEVALTYINGTGGTEQKTWYSLPYDINFYSVEDGTCLYISAQNQTDTGSVTCEIYVDGKLFKTSTSSGAYVIADCSGTLE